MAILFAKDKFNSRVYRLIALEGCLDAHCAGAVIADAEFPVGIALTAYAFDAFAKVVAVGVVGRNNNADKWGVFI